MFAAPCRAGTLSRSIATTRAYENQSVTMKWAIRLLDSMGRAVSICNASCLESLRPIAIDDAIRCLQTEQVFIATQRKSIDRNTRTTYRWCSTSWDPPAICRRDNTYRVREHICWQQTKQLITNKFRNTEKLLQHSLPRKYQIQQTTCRSIFCVRLLERTTAWFRVL